MQTSAAEHPPRAPASQTGKPLATSLAVTLRATRAPIITTSPWAKLIRPMMP